MRIIALRTLREFWQQSSYADSEESLRAWFNEAKIANWATPADVKALYRNSSIIADNRVVFNICGNKYRLIVKINYPYRVVYIRFLGTHREYDKINAETI